MLSRQHPVEMSGQAFDNSIDQRLSSVGSCEGGLLVRLICSCVQPDIFGKCRQSEGGLELLSVPGKVLRQAVPASQDFFGIRFGQDIPVGHELQIDLKKPDELVPCRLTACDISSMAIEDEDIFESRAHHALDQIGQNGQKRARPKRERSRMAHMVLANPSHHSFRHDDFGPEPLGDRDRDVAYAPPIMLHLHMLQMLLDSGNGNDTSLQLS